MKKNKPWILVTGPDRGGFLSWFFTAWALRRAGGKPIRIRPGKVVKKDFDWDGLVVGGGADIDPKLYGGLELKDLQKAASEEHKTNRWASVLLGLLVLLFRKIFSLGHLAGVDNERDKMERMYIEKALQRGRPILGICRGAQLINIVCGGTLHQSLENYYQETARVDTVFPRKEVELEPQSRLAQCVGLHRLRVNSLHRQAVDQLGRDIHVVAREKNGVIQGIELKSAPFVLGLQWHPEYLPQIASQRKIFQKLVKVAGRKQLF